MELSSYLLRNHLKLALTGKITDYLQSTTANLYDYEALYRTSNEREKSGPRPAASANFFNLTNILSISDVLFNHPLFGFKNLDTRLSVKSECEFCWMGITAINSDQIAKLSTPIWSASSVTTSNDVIPNDIGNFQLEITCQYKQNVNSRCPKVLNRAKTLMRNLALRNEEKLTQYWNTPTCDESNDFWMRYWSPKNYNVLLKAKRVWDPINVFNHCQSIGSTDEKCCPKNI